MTEWYVSIDGQKRGPGSADALRGFLKNNDPKRFRVWREGFDDWTLASEVTELSGEVSPPLPVLVAADRMAGQETTQAATRERTAWKWAGFGAIGGVAFALFNMTIRGTWSMDPAVLAGQLVGSAFLCGLIGLLSGAIHDAIGAPVPLPAPDLAAVQARRGGNFIVRHWRGDLKLWVSYWAINFVGYAAVAVVAPRHRSGLRGNKLSLSATQPSLRAAKQSRAANKDWIASSAFGVLAMTA